MADKKVNFIVGLVVLVALAILIYGVYFLKDQKFGEKKNLYHVVFDKVSTLTVNDPVKLNGVTMGRVKSIELWDNRVRVTFSVKQYFDRKDGTRQPIRIPVNSEVTVQNIGLMGERQIDIQLGDSKEYHPVGALIENGRFDAGIAEAMGTAGKVFERAEELVLSVQILFDSTLGQEEFVSLFRDVLENTKHLTVRMDALITHMDPKLRSSLDNLERAGLELERILSEEDGPVRGLLQDGRDMTQKMGTLSDRVESIAGEFNAILEKVNSNEGTLGALIQDTTFHTDLLSTVRNADSLLSIIRKQGLDVNVDIF